MTALRVYEELPREEQKEIVAFFSNWLKNYTHSVIVKVMERRQEIIDDPWSMRLLRELYERDNAQAEKFTTDIEMYFRDFDTFKEYDPHNDALNHANSYRDVLYDMYIK